jgi:dimethylglycine dehydrogenase
VTPFYMRQERDGLMISCYESKPVFWGLDGIPRDFGRELLPDDLERASATLERTMDFIPAFGRAGIKSVINGPLGRTPDVVGRLGPAHGLRGYWVFCGEMAGFFRSSAARYLAQWIIAGEPDIDLSVLDVRRFDARMGREFAVERLNSRHVYSLPVYYPHVEPGGSRGFKTSPIYGRLQSRGAVFGERNGWEVPNWFSPDGAGATEEPSLEHANWLEPVGVECRAIQHRVGLIDLTSQAKFSVEGAGSAAWLDWLCANRLPMVGQISRAPFLTEGGRVAASFTMARLADDRFYLTDWAVNEQRDLAWLEGASPISDIEVRNVTTDIAVIGVSGPMSRDVLQSLFDDSPASGHFPLSPVGEIKLAGIRVTVLKVGLTGELDYEIHCEASDQVGLYEALLEAGRTYGIVDFGFRALDSLRLEKGWFCSGIDYGMAAKPWNVGLSPWIDLNKGNFLGSIAYKKDIGRDGHSQPAALIIDTNGDRIAPWGEEPILCGGKEIGFTTSGGYGHRIGKAIALASLPQPIPDDQPIAVELLGKSYRAEASTVPPYDPEGHRMSG